MLQRTPEAQFAGDRRIAAAEGVSAAEAMARWPEARKRFQTFWEVTQTTDGWQEASDCKYSHCELMGVTQSGALFRLWRHPHETPRPPEENFTLIVGNVFHDDISIASLTTVIEVPDGDWTALGIGTHFLDANGNDTPYFLKLSTDGCLLTPNGDDRHSEPIQFVTELAHEAVSVAKNLGLSDPWEK